MTSSSNRPAFFPTLQNLRGVAAFMVLLFHMEFWEKHFLEAFQSPHSGYLDGLFSNGFAGVDLFFVISGFIMVIVTADAKPGVKTSLSFLWARVFRIFPIWWLYMGLFIFGLYFVVGNTGVLTPPNAPEGVTAPDIGFVLKSFFLVPQASLPLYGLGWTLIHEMVFYSVFAVFLLFGRSRLIGLILLWGAAILLLNSGVSKPVADSYFVLGFHLNNLEFVFGALSGFALLRWRGKAGVWVLVMGLAGLMTTLSLYTQTNAAETLAYGRVLPFGLPCAAIVYGAGALDFQRLHGLCQTIFLTFMLGCGVCLVAVGVLAYTAYGVALGLSVWAAAFWVFWVCRNSPVFVVHWPAKMLDQFLFNIGNASYTLYLSHWLVLFGVSAVLPKILTLVFSAFGIASSEAATVVNDVLISPSGQFAIVLLGFVASLIFALLAFHWVERPLVRLGRSAQKKLFR